MSPTAIRTRTIEVDAPLRVAYSQWVQFEEFPRFMDGVRLVKQVDDDRLLWTTDIEGVEERFETVITEQVSDRRLAWRSETGPSHAAVVTFLPIDDDRSRVTFQLEFDREDAPDIFDGRVEGDLARFAALVPDRLVASTAWRGAARAQDTGLICR